MAEMQYGQGLIDWAHVEIFPISTAKVGLYLPVPRTDRTLLCAYKRAGGPTVEVHER